MSTPVLRAPRMVVPRVPLVAVMLLLGALGLVAVAAPAAHAGDYQVSYCRDEAGAPRSLVDWVQTNTNSATGDSATNGCGDGNDVMVIDWTTNAARPTAAQTSWLLNAVGGNRIVGWSAQASTLNQSSDTAVVLTGLPSCLSWQGCTNAAFGGASAELDQPSAEFYIGCRSNGGAPCNGTASARLYSNVVTFRDPRAPASTATVQGSLTGGLPVSGTVSATAAATDAGSGVRHIGIQVDGTEIASSPDKCDPPYDRQRPCPTGLSATVKLDTSTIGDGTHTARVVAVDASGNVGVLWSGSLIVSAGKRIGPGTDLGVRGAPNGGYASDAATITAAWPATGRKASSDKAVRRRCRASKAYRRTHRLACDGRAAQRDLTSGFSSKRSNLLRGRLRTRDGQPIAGATVRIVARPRSTGAATTVVGTPVTGQDGRFVARVPVATGSARFSVDWLARSRDTVPATSAPLRRSVRAGTSFRTSPTRTVSRGRRLTFSGRLLGTAGVPQGNAIAIQANAGGGWRAAKTVRTREGGRWRAVYVVPSQLRGRYRFRAVVTPSASYPYSIGTSTTRSVTVR